MLTLSPTYTLPHSACTNQIFIDACILTNLRWNFKCVDFTLTCNTNIVLCILHSEERTKKKRPSVVIQFLNKYVKKLNASQFVRILM